MARHTPGNYVPLDVNYPRDAAIRRAGPDAELLFVRSLAYCKAARTDGFVPDYDLPVVSVGLRAVPKSVKALVAEQLWVASGGGWVVRSWEKWNQPVTSEDEFIAGQSEAGLKGNHKRWHVDRGVTDPECPLCQNPSRVPDRVRDSAPESGCESPLREGKGREGKNTRSSAPADGLFDEFWTLYPRKISKGQAHKAWNAAIKKADAATITAGLQAQLPAMTQADPKFIPHASTWLNGERWSDEPQAQPVTREQGAWWA